MKTIYTNMKIAALAFVILFSTQIAMATNGNDDNAKPKVVTYLGNVNDLPVYRLALPNVQNDTYQIIIKDNTGELIHSEKISGASILRNYQLSEVPSYDYSLIFEVRNLTENKKSVYQISKTQRVFEEVQVSQLK